MSTLILSRSSAENGSRALSTAKPEPPKRVVALDAARGVALLGMVAVHSLPRSTASGDPTWPFAIFAGRAAAVFAVLAGVGIAYLTGRARVRRTDGFATVAALGVRALAIGTAGLALGYADKSLAVVILPVFALLYLLVIPLVFLPTWAVAVTGVAVTIGAPVLSHVLLPGLPDPMPDNPTFAHLVRDPLGLLTELSITGEFPALPWLAYLCAGLVIGRLSLTKKTVALGLLITGVLLADAASFTSSVLLHRYGGLSQIIAAQPQSGLTVSETLAVLTLGSDGTVPTTTWWWLAVDSPHTGTPLDVLVTTGSAIALIGAMLVAGTITRPVPRRLVAVVRTPLAAAGGMPLTCYVAHIIFIDSEYNTFAPVTGFLVQAAAALAIGFIVRGTMVRGPLEALVAGLTAFGRHWASPPSQRRARRIALAAAPIPVEKT